MLARLRDTGAMKRTARATLGLLALSTALSACAEPPPAAPPPPPAPPPLPPLPLSPPPLLAVPRAEATRRPASRRRPQVPSLRSEGKRHALERTRDGIVVLSEDRGVVGFINYSSEIRWAGFLADDAVVIASGGSLLRAKTPDDAVAGSFEPLATIDPSATKLASAGKVIVAAVAEDGGAIRVSRDGGKRFVTERRPAKGAIVDVAVRGDGMVVMAFEREKVKVKHGEATRAEIHVSRGPGAWVKGPMAQTSYRPLLLQHGDLIAIDAPKKGAKEGRTERLSLDARGKWIAAGYADAGWLGFAWVGPSISIEPPKQRAGIPKGVLDGRSVSGLLGVLGGIAGRCRGVACLGHRSPSASDPTVAAFQDGVCAKDRVVERTEKIHVPDGGHDEDGEPRERTYTVRECAPDAPAVRASTLLVRGGATPVIARLPLSCASGRVLATDRAAFVHCDAKHQGKAEILHVAASGALATIVPSLPEGAKLFGAESASDGTTVLFGKHAAWLCGPSACTSVPHAGFLAARPVPGGRALVAWRGDHDHDLVLGVVGAGTAVPFHLAVQDNVLEIELTAEGYVRLWTSPTRTWFDPKKSARHLVRADGVLVPDASPM